MKVLLHVSRHWSVFQTKCFKEHSSVCVFKVCLFIWKVERELFHLLLYMAPVHWSSQQPWLPPCCVPHSDKGQARGPLCCPPSAVVSTGSWSGHTSWNWCSHVGCPCRKWAQYAVPQHCHPNVFLLHFTSVNSHFSVNLLLKIYLFGRQWTQIEWLSVCLFTPLGLGCTQARSPELGLPHGE